MFQRFLAIALVTAACGTTPKRPVSPPAPPAGAGEVIGADGHFTKERVYEGDCMPAGSRGGCHTVTLRPDGTFRNFLFDAAIEGTYSIEGSAVALKGPDPEPIVMTLSEDRTKLDTLTLKP